MTANNKSLSELIEIVLICVMIKLKDVFMNYRLVEFEVFGGLPYNKDMFWGCSMKKVENQWLSLLGRQALLIVVIPIMMLYALLAFCVLNNLTFALQ